MGEGGWDGGWGGGRMICMVGRVTESNVTSSAIAYGVSGRKGDSLIVWEPVQWF